MLLVLYDDDKEDSSLTVYIQMWDEKISSPLLGKGIKNNSI